VSPDALQNMPAGHEEHSDDALPALKVPIEQARQAADDVLPALGLCVPAGHVLQDEDDVLPVLGLYAPGWHKVQTFG
jgi:hypothetical protein